ncbi:MAG: GAF domain-containing protein [Bacillota bacterium]
MKWENHLFQENLSRENKQLQALYTVATAVGKSLQLGEVLEAALEKVLEITTMEAGGILIVNDEKQELIPTIHKNFPAELVRDLTNRKLGNGLCGRIAVSGKPLISPCIEGDERVHSEAAKREKYKSYAGFPLIAKNKVVGVMEIVDHEYRHFNEQDIELLASIGHTIGVAIENAKLYERSNRQSEHLSRALSLLEHNSSLFNAFASSFSALTETIINGAITLLKAPVILLALSEPQGEKIYWYPWNNCPVQPEILSPLENLLKKSLKEENTLLMDASLSPDFPPSLIKYDITSLIIIPLFPEKRGGYGGLFGLGHTRLSFMHEDLLLLRTFANQATVALENWWLYKREATMVNELQNLNQLIENQNKALERLVGIHNQLTQLVLEEGGFKAMADSLACLLDSTVVVQDRFWNIMACSCCSGNHETGAGDFLLNTEKVKLLRESGEMGKESFLTGKRISHFPALPSCGLTEALAVVPVAGGSKVIGYITAVKRGREFKKTDSMALEQAATALALEFMKQRIAFETEFRLKGDFVDDLFAGNYGEDELKKRAHHLGYDLGAFKRVVLISCSAQQKDEHEKAVISLSSETVLREIRNLIHDRFPGSIVAAKSDRINILLSVKDYIPAHELKEQIKNFSFALFSSVGHYLSHDDLNAGVGKNASSIRELRESYEEALQCLQVMKIFGTGGQVVFLDDLGLFSLFLPLHDKKKLISFAVRYIEPIFAYDEEHGMNLLPTLRSFLEHNCNYQETVSALFIHANTLRYRLKRIQELTGIDLNKIEDRVNAYMALQIVQLLKVLKPDANWQEICRA